MKNLRSILRQYWGYDSFLPLQEEAMDCVLSGRDSVVVLPTGGGKSLCFQAPAMCMPGLAVVVSPLISLMKDQVDALKSCGVPAACINSSLSYDQRRMVAAEIRRGTLKLLYVAPERLVLDSFIEYLKQTELSLIAVDEAHCISAWGHDFRPEYRKLRIMKEAFPGISVHAYTATATKHVRDDISRELCLNDPNILVGSFDRPNLIYSVKQRSNRLSQICSVLDRHRSESGIIYCIRRADVDDLCAALTDKGYKALPYHAGMSNEDRKKNQEAFIQEEVNTIVATIAFGMGIDKSNVRYVVHSGMPKSLEHYQQESGRAGRDGLEAECCMFFSGGDFGVWQSILRDLEGEASEIALSKLRGMYNYCMDGVCRHKAIVSYFGQELGKEQCDACDVCLGEIEVMDDPLIVSQKILSCVVRLKERFGADYTAKVLVGSAEQRIKQSGHSKLSTYGILSDNSRQDVRGWAEQLIDQGCLQRTGEYNTLSVTDKGWRVLRAQETPRLLKPAKKAPKQARIAVDSWEGVDMGLFDVLRALQFKKAREQGVPPFMVFNEAALRDMARRRPSTREGFLGVRGVGQKKCEDYGEEFLKVIAEYCAANSVEMDSTFVPVADEQHPDSIPTAAKRRAFDLFEQGSSVEEVMQLVDRAQSTVFKYLEEYIKRKQLTHPTPWVDDEIHSRVREAVENVGMNGLRPIFEFLNGEISYEQIRVSVACLRSSAGE